MIILGSDKNKMSAVVVIQLDTPIISAKSTEPINVESECSLIAGATDYNWRYSYATDMSGAIEVPSNEFLNIGAQLADEDVYFTVQAIDALGGIQPSAFSLPFHLKVDSLIETNIQLSAVPVSAVQIDLTANLDSGVNLYKFEVADSLEGARTLLQETASNTYSHSGLSANTTKFYFVNGTVINGNYEAPFESNTSATTLSTGQLQPTSNIVIVNDAAADELLLTWVKSANSNSTKIRYRELIVNGVVVPEVWVDADATPYAGSSAVTGTFTDGVLYRFEFIESDTNAVHLDSDPITFDHLKANVNQSATALSSYGAVGRGSLLVEEFTTTPLVGENKTLVTYTGAGADPFSAANVGDVFEVWRNHLDTAFSEAGKNYIPGIITSVLSNISDFIDGKNVKVDFVYNGGNMAAPETKTNVSGIFGQPIREILKTVGEDPSRENIITLERDGFYILNGFPSIELLKQINPIPTGAGSPPILYIATSDAFDLNEQGQKANSQSFKDTYGDKNFFKLNNAGNNGVVFDGIDICPPVFTYPGIQDSPLYASLFIDSNSYPNENNRACLIKNSNTFRIRDMIITKRGSDFSGATYNYPNLGLTFSGGITGDRGDGVLDVISYAKYGYHNTALEAFMVHNLKSKSVAGIIFEAINDGVTPLKMQENLKVKVTGFNNIRLRFRKEVDSITGATFAYLESDTDGFNFYLAANQYWSGGARTNNSKSLSWQIGNDIFTLGNLGDSMNIFGRTKQSYPKPNLFKTPTKVQMFNKFPEVGEVITRMEVYFYPLGRITDINGNFITVDPTQHRRSRTGGAFTTTDWSLDEWPCAPITLGDDAYDNYNAARSEILNVDTINNIIEVADSSGFEIDETMTGRRDEIITNSGYTSMKTGVVRKIDDYTWHFFGFNLSKDDVLLSSQGAHKVLSSEFQRRSDNWPLLAEEAATTIGAKIYEVIFDAPCTLDVKDVSFTVSVSTTEHYYTDDFAVGAIDYGTHVQHLWYTDQGINKVIKNYILGDTDGLESNAGGYWRATGSGLPVTAQDLRGAMRYANFEKVQGGAGGGIGREWSGASMKLRQELDPTDCEYIVKDCALGMNQTSSSQGQITIGSGTLPQQMTSSKFQLYSPLFEQGFTGWGDPTGVYTDAGAKFYLKDGDFLDLTLMRLCASTIIVEGTVTIKLNSYTAYLHTSGKYNGVLISSAAAGSVVNIVGDGGKTGIKLSDSAKAVLNSSAAIKINLTNWELTENIFDGTKIGIPFTRSTDPEGAASYDANFSIRDENDNDIDPNRN